MHNLRNSRRECSFPAIAQNALQWHPDLSTYLLQSLQALGRLPWGLWATWSLWDKMKLSLCTWVWNMRIDAGYRPRTEAIVHSAGTEGYSCWSGYPDGLWSHICDAWRKGEGEVACGHCWKEKVSQGVSDVPHAGISPGWVSEYVEASRIISHFPSSVLKGPQFIQRSVL